MMASSGSTMANAIAPSTTRAIASWRCLLRISGVSAKVAAIVVSRSSALSPLDDQVGNQVHRERDREQQDADHEQHLIVRRADGRLAELRRDGGRQRAHRVER